MTTPTSAATPANACSSTGRRRAVRCSAVRNIRSMRSVIRKPPKALVAEQVTAAKPSIVHTQPLGTLL